MCFNLSSLVWKSVEGTDSTTGDLLLLSMRARFQCPSGYGPPSGSMDTVSQGQFGMLVIFIGSSLSLFVATWHS